MAPLVRVAATLPETDSDRKSRTFLGISGPMLSVKYLQFGLSGYIALKVMGLIRRSSRKRGQRAISGTHDVLSSTASFCKFNAWSARFAMVRPDWCIISLVCPDILATAVTLRRTSTLAADCCSEAVAKVSLCRGW
ncbi:MAG: hypothetical protein EA399_06955 [Desulfovibrionales bacterium]|nr:MAG: hypothetical protein EA399_06955 [Desulfovibrionales bacterium]